MEDRQLQIESTEEIGGVAGTLVDGAKYLGTQVFSFFFKQYLNIVVSFLSSVQSQLAQLIPPGSETMDKYEQARLMSAAINEVFNDPVFKAQIATFSDNIKAIIQPFLTEMNELMAREGDALASSAFKITNRVSRNAIAGVLEGVEGALTLFPGVGTVIDLLNVLQGFFDSASVISTEFFSNMTKVTSAFLKVYGETSGPIVDTIKSAEETINSLQEIFGKIQNIQNVGKQLQVTRGGKKKKKTIRKRKNKQKY
jgi:hypothetical protein